MSKDKNTMKYEDLYLGVIQVGDKLFIKTTQNVCGMLIGINDITSIIPICQSENALVEIKIITNLSPSCGVNYSVHIGDLSKEEANCVMTSIVTILKNITIRR